MSVRNARLKAVAASSLLLLLVLAGCTPPGQTDGIPEQQSWTSTQLKDLAKQEAEAGHDTQAERLEDGKVSFEEYQAAFGDLARCLEVAGITVSDPVISPVSNDRYEFTMDVGALDPLVGAELSDECAAEHWTSVSQGYMFTQTPVMDTPVRDATVSCLKDEGLKPTGTETKAYDFASLPDADPETVTQCIMNAVEETYPGLPAVTVAF